LTDELKESANRDESNAVNGDKSLSISFEYRNSTRKGTNIAQFFPKFGKHSLLNVSVMIFIIYNRIKLFAY
jgi:hypothetical protein